MKQKRYHKRYDEPYQKKDPNKPKIVKKCYHITTQTAYHITQLALQENTSEGRILDKIIRDFQACSGQY